MEDINNLLNAGEVPNLFPLDEKQEICEKMRQLDRYLAFFTSCLLPLKLNWYWICFTWNLKKRFWMKKKCVHALWWKEILSKLRKLKITYFSLLDKGIKLNRLMEPLYPYLTSSFNVFVTNSILYWPWVPSEMPSVTDCVNFRHSSIVVPLIGSR